MDTPTLKPTSPTFIRRSLLFRFLLLVVIVLPLLIAKFQFISGHGIPLVWSWTPPTSSSLIYNTQTSQPNTKPTHLSDPLQPSAVPNPSCSVPQLASYPLQPPEERYIHYQLREYIAFHKRARACLLNPDCKQKPKILVARCSRTRSCAGLGDRMRGIIFSLTIALITRRVFFIHELSTLFPLKYGLVPYAIDWTLPPTVQFNLSWPHLEWHWCKPGRPCEGNSPLLTEFQNFDDEGPEINMFTHDIVDLFRNRPVATITSRNHVRRLRILQQNPHLKHKYSGLADFIIKKKINFLRLLFQPSEATLQTMKAVEFKGDYIGVHIRNGVDSRESGTERFQYLASHEEETVDDILECMGRVGENIRNVFLASDSPRTKELFAEKAKEKGYNVHLFGEKTIHSNRFGSRVRSMESDALCDAFFTTFSDLFMLTRAKVMIRTGSNFASFAGFLAAKGHQTIVEFNPTTDSLEEACQA